MSSEMNMYEQWVELDVRKVAGRRQKAMFYKNLGKTAQANGELRKAEDYYKEACVIYENSSLIRDIESKTELFMSLGDVKRMMGDLDSAVAYYEQAKKNADFLYLFGMEEDIGMEPDYDQMIPMADSSYAIGMIDIERGKALIDKAVVIWKQLYGKETGKEKSHFE